MGEPETNEPMGVLATARSEPRGITDFSPLTYAEATFLVDADGFAPRSIIAWHDGAAELTVELDPR
jgi:hypothetical protein